MMGDEPQEEDESINLVLRIGMMTDTDKGKQPKEEGWVHKALEK